MNLHEYVKTHAALRTNPEINQQTAMILEILREEPNHSVVSLAKKTGLPRYIVNERVTRLAKAGKIQYVSMWIVTAELER
jgi:DNA-binding Lrp family transcriptional regulator